MKKLALVLILASCAGDPSVDDTATIIGTVTDAAGNAIPAARITTTPPTETVMTNADGAYSIAKNVKRGGTYEVLAEHEGYGGVTNTLTTIKGENRVDFMLAQVFVCTAGSARCVQGGQIENCDVSRTKWNASECPNDQVCDDAAGPTSAVCTEQVIVSVTVAGADGGVVLSSPAGISCNTGTCMAGFPRGRTVTLTASPFTAFVFDGYSGACTGTEPVCTLMLDGPKTVTATFDQSGYFLTLNRLGGRGRITSMPAGINCGATCSAAFAQNEMITLTANPDPGSQFGGWGGACASAGMNLTCMITLDSDLEVDFRFQTPQFDLTVTKNGSGVGTVTSDPDGIDCGATCASSFDQNTMVTLTAEPMAGSNFIGWGGACTGTGDCMVVLDQDRAVTATFDGIAHQVTVARAGGGTGVITSQPGGINCGATCSAQFGQGQMIDLVAAPQGGSVFLGWTGDCATADRNPTCTLTVTAPLSATATFQPFFFGPFTPDASCLQLIHFDSPTPFAQQCGGGSPIVVVGTIAVVASRSVLLIEAPEAGGATEEGHIELNKLGPDPINPATIEMTVRKIGNAFGGRPYGVLYSNQDALDANTRGVRLLVHNDGRFAVETRAASGTISTAETAVNTIQNNTWYHLAATISATTGISLFVDGAALVLVPGPLGWSASSSTAWAGAEREGAAGSIYRWNGAIDELRVSDVLRY